MSSSTSHKRGSHSRGAHGGGGSHGGHGGGGGGGGGGGKLVKVGFGRNQAEAEMLQGLLMEEGGIPSVLKRSGGFDNPDFLAAGPHDVYVDSDAAQKAREILAETMLESEDEEREEVAGAIRGRGGGGPTSPYALAFWVAVAAVGALVLVWILYEATG